MNLSVFSKTALVQSHGTLKPDIFFFKVRNIVSFLTPNNPVRNQCLIPKEGAETALQQGTPPLPGAVLDPPIAPKAGPQTDPPNS